MKARESGTTGEALAALPAETQAGLARCRETLRRLGRVAVAFSGGVDSSFLLAESLRTLGKDNVLALHAVAPIFPSWERREARELAERLGANLLEIPTDQLEDPEFLGNPPRRCYLCKKRLFARLLSLAAARGFAVVASGANADDAGDFRPGMQAEAELGIARPLLEAGLTKADIRAAARAMGLANWNKPPCACLATRIPYGQAITLEALARIEQAETFLHEMGFAACRVRDHGNLARVEVSAEAIERAAAARSAVAERLKALGYTYVALDLEGYRSGSMNEAL